MSQHLYAVHDFDPAWAAMLRDANVTGWCVSTHEIGDDPNDPSGHDFRDRATYNITTLARLNYSHHGQGTIPLPNRYNEFAARCANFVAASPGCNLWIIGNEPNLGGERPNGIAITPEDYARAFTLCRNAIKRVNANHQVIIAPVAPYNVDTGPWIDYWRRVLLALEPTGADGLAIHCYGRGPNPASVSSEDKMDAPYDAYYNGFRAYRDFLAAVPTSMRSLPVYITETDQNEPWLDANTGWVQAAYAEIDRHNHTPGVGSPLGAIQCLTLYRWYQHDKWEFSSKQGVIDDFRAAVAKGYPSPDSTSQNNAQNYRYQTHLPAISTGESPALPPRAWDERLTARGVTIDTPQVAPGEVYWRVVAARWFSEAEAGGRRHIYVEAITPDGRPVANVPFEVAKPDGDEVEYTKGGKGFDAGNFPMWPSQRDLSVKIADGVPSETVSGIEMGADGNAGVHTSTLVTYQLATMPSVATGGKLQAAGTEREAAGGWLQAAGGREAAGAEGEPTANSQQLTAKNSQQLAASSLIHPIQDPAKRRISQRFGENPDAYAQFGMAGHTGIDYAVPTGTPVVAVDDGKVIQASYMQDYGNVIKLQHLWGESVYAHLDTFRVLPVGATVQRGQVIGLSGNTGNSTGPHLHFAIRIYPYQRGAPWDGFSDPEPYLTNTPPEPTQPAGDVLSAIKSAANEFGIPWQLLASQAWAESGFDPRAESSGGAQGLLQIMPSTWAEWSPNLGAGSDPFDARQNARVGAAYLKWLLSLTGNNPYQALIAYGWGIGNWQSERPRPQMWVEYANKVMHGRDLLVAVGA